MTAPEFATEWQKLITELRADQTCAEPPTVEDGLDEIREALAFVEANLADGDDAKAIVFNLATAAVAAERACAAIRDRLSAEAMRALVAEYSPA